MENEYYERNLQKIKDITGAFEIKDEVKDFLTDIKDETDKFNFTEIYSIIKLKYKVRNERSAIFAISNHGQITYTKSELNSFVEKCENAKEMSLINVYLVSFDTNNIEKVEFKSIMYNLSNRLSSINTNLYFSNSLNGYTNNSSYSSLEDFLNNEGLSRTIYLYLITDIDKDKFIPDSSDDLLPSNIIDDFNTFIKKYRIPSNDKNKLINIIRKGYLNEGIYYDEYNVIRKEMMIKSEKMHDDITDEFDHDIEWSLDYDSYFNVDFIIKYKSKDFNRILDLLDLLVECQSNFLSKNMSIQCTLIRLFNNILLNASMSSMILPNIHVSWSVIDFNKVKEYFINDIIPKKTSNPPVTRDGLLDFNIRIGISG